MLINGVRTLEQAARVGMVDSFARRFKLTMEVKILGRARAKCPRPGCGCMVHGVLEEPRGLLRFACTDVTCFVRGMERPR